MIPEASRDLWRVRDALAPMPPERLAEAAGQLAAVIAALCPGAVIERNRLDATAFSRWSDMYRPDLSA